jgi:putative photosynthetic complex assembly protein
MAEAQTRVYSAEDRMLPCVLIRGVLAMICAAMAITVYARVTDRPLVSTPPVSPVKAEAALVLEANATSGAARVYLADGTLLANLTPEEGGFIAGVERVIARERTKNRITDGGPVVLQAYENGRMAVTDPATGWSADLMGFGADNAAAFARLLALAEKGND